MRLRSSIAQGLVSAGLGLSLALLHQPAALAAGGWARTVDRDALMERYASCVINRKPEAVDAFVLESDPAKALRIAERMGIAFKACLRQMGGGRLQAGSWLLRGDFARTLWLRGAVASRPYHVPVLDGVANPSEQTMREYLAGAFAACLLERAPEAAMAFTRASTRSASEKAVFDRLREPAASCTQDAEVGLRLGSEELRAALALQLYGRTAGSDREGSLCSR